jgi:hypothetical protein
MDRCHGVILLVGARRILRERGKSIKDFAWGESMGTGEGGLEFAGEGGGGHAAGGGIDFGALGV